ncbi:MAG: cupin domain-containing protein [Defluviitaleaceae bacterium]|nr:cupin domain-containing protein [Defluviitaleaceae bacterium]
MKDLIIKNLNEIEPILYDRGADNIFSVKEVVAGENIDKCSASFIEVPPGKYAFGYHYHDQSEEIFYIVKGKGLLRCHDGERDVKEGDMLCFPTGEKGAHVLKNTSDTENLIFVDFGTKTSKTDIVTLPDANKVMLIGEHMKFTILDLPKED